MSRDNHWDHLQPNAGKNKQRTHDAAQVLSDCENSLCCSVHYTISYDLLIALLVMQLLFIALHRPGLIKHPDSPCEKVWEGAATHRLRD